MTPRRIAIQTDGFLVQGNERQIAALAGGLVERGHEVHISARPDSPAWHHFAATGALMSDARVRGTGDLLSASRFALWLRRVAPHAVLFTSWRRLWIAAAAARAAGVPNRVMRFGGRHYVPPGWRGAHYRHALVRLVHRVYANSALVRDHLIDTVPGLRPDRVHLVPNGIEPSQPPPAPLRARLGLPADAPIVTGVGGLVHLKGFDLLIRACAPLERAQLVICGGGIEEERLRDLARALGADARVHLLGPCDDVPAILAAADVFVLSSRTEGFSVALLEAMRAGLPIIATDVGGVRDALCDEDGTARAGWVVPAGDAAALNAALADVLRHPGSDAVRARASEARRRVVERYTVDRMVDGVERVLFGG